jgi:DNA-directed RNA polymerase specialized sigma24 family protein
VPGKDAADVVQEVFLTVFMRIKTFTKKDEKPAAFRRWLYGITRYKVLEYWAARSDWPTVIPGSESWIGMFPATDPPRDDSREIKVRPVDKPNLCRVLELIRPDWEVFWQCAVEARSAEDVANELGISPCEVETAVSRVWKCLREEDEDGVPGRVLLLRGLLELIQLDFEPDTFQAFWRVAVDGCSAEEVAGELGMKNVGAVYTAKCRVRKRLREELKALGFDSSDGDVVIADVAAVAQHEVTS